MLTARTLHFGSSQLSWECRTLNASETCPEGLPPLFQERLDSNLKRWVPETRDEVRQLSSQFSHDSNLSAYWAWKEVVKLYSRCEVTYERDKLVALSGTAKQLSTLLGDDYLAGLWRRCLPSHLLWYARGSKQGNGRPSRRPSTYRAPTWSWASLDATVGFPFEAKSGGLLDVLEAQTFPVTGAPFGQIEGGYLLLSGYVCAAELRDSHLMMLEFREDAYEAVPYLDVEPSNGFVMTRRPCLLVQELDEPKGLEVWGRFLSALSRPKIHLKESAYSCSEALMLNVCPCS